MRQRIMRQLALCLALALPIVALSQLLAAPAAGPAAAPGFASMLAGIEGWESAALFTVGETISDTGGVYNPTSAGSYTPPGVLDGLGAYEVDAATVRIFANHEMPFYRGYDYQVSAGLTGTFSLDGARISYFDIDKETLAIVDAGLAISTIYDATGAVAVDNSFLPLNRRGFSRFCSGVLVEAAGFGAGQGLVDRIYFAGEEEGGGGNPVGGAEWALDPATGEFWHIPAIGRGAWENIAPVDTGTTTHVAFILADDTSPFDADGDTVKEAAPLFLYVGQKDSAGDFLARNGLRGGRLFVWVADSGETTPLAFNGGGTLAGRWIELDNTPQPSQGSEDGSTGYDEFGFPTQRNLWTQAEAAGAFGFSRPEDVATNPNAGHEVVLAATGVDTYAIDPQSGNGADTFGTLYTVATDFTDIDNPTANLTIIYDGDADLSRAIRSPDNLAWAENGYIFVQEDESEEESLTGEPLFGPGAINPHEAGIIRVDPAGGATWRVANIDRSVVLDASVSPATAAVDRNAGRAGEWESSGIIDVSSLFGRFPGTLFLLDVQAHGISSQQSFNPTSRLHRDDLVEGGQLILLSAPIYKRHFPVAAAP